MADKKFGKKRVCSNCEVKFYDLNKKIPITCPHCNTEFIVEDSYTVASEEKNRIQESKLQAKDEFADIENAESNDQDDEVISLDDAIEEEAQEAKN